MNKVTAMNENLQLLIRATSALELLKKLQQPTASMGSANPAEWMQLSEFLKCCAFNSWLAYPLSVYRDPDVGGIPDFTIQMAERSVGVELTMITCDQLEKSRHDQVELHRAGIKLGAFAVASLKVDPRKRGKVERLNETQIPMSRGFPPTVEQVEEAWLEQFPKSCSVCGM